MHTKAGKDNMIFSVDTEALGYDYFCRVLRFSTFTIIPPVPVTRISFINHQRSKTMEIYSFT